MLGLLGTKPLQGLLLLTRLSIHPGPAVAGPWACSSSITSAGQSPSVRLQRESSQRSVLAKCNSLAAGFGLSASQGLLPWSPIAARPLGGQYLVPRSQCQCAVCELQTRIVTAGRRGALAIDDVELIEMHGRRSGPKRLPLPGATAR